MPDGSLPARGAGVVNLPNAISFARLCAVPVAVWLTLRMQFGPAFVLVGLAALSDGVDGWLARRRGGSAFGAMLDPVADKALLVSMVVTLGITGRLPDWLVILVVFRDVVIAGGVLLLWQLAIPVRIRPLVVSKLNTGLQLLLVAVALLSGFAALAAAVLPVLIWIVAVSTLLSGAAYVWVVARGRLT